jgi:hypothetical protein
MKRYRPKSSPREMSRPINVDIWQRPRRLAHQIGGCTDPARKSVLVSALKNALKHAIAKTTGER